MSQHPCMAQLYEQLKELQQSLLPQLEKVFSVEKTFNDKFEEIKSTLSTSPSVGAGEGTGSADTSMDNKVEETGPKEEPTKEQREREAAKQAKQAKEELAARQKEMVDNMKAGFIEEANKAEAAKAAQTDNGEAAADKCLG